MTDNNDNNKNADLDEVYRAAFDHAIERIKQEAAQINVAINDNIKAAKNQADLGCYDAAVRFQQVSNSDI